MNEVKNKIRNVLFDYRLNVSSAEQAQGGDGDLEAIQRAENQATQAIQALITEQVRLGRIDELGGIQLEHGRYVTQTFVDGQAMTIMERIAQLKKEDK